MTVDNANVLKHALDALVKVATLKPDLESRHEHEDETGKKVHTVKKGTIGAIRKHLNNVHKDLEGPRRYRKMVKDFTFTSKKGKKFVIKKGDNIALRQRRLQSSILQLFHPYKIFYIDKKVVDQLLAVSVTLEDYDKHKAEIDKKHGLSEENKSEHEGNHKEHEHEDHDEDEPEAPEGEDSEHEDSDSHESNPEKKKPQGEFEPSDFKGEDENGKFTAKLDVDSKEFTRHYHGGKVIRGIRKDREEDAGYVSEDLPDLPSGPDHFVRTYSVKKKRGGKKDTAGVMPNVRLFFLPKNDDVLHFESDKQFDGGPASFVVLHVSHGYCSFLHNGEVNTIPVDGRIDDKDGANVLEVNEPGQVKLTGTWERNGVTHWILQ